MPRDSGYGEDLNLGTALPSWVAGEKRLSQMLPYVSLVSDTTIRTRGNELMQCIRLEGVNSTTSEDAHLDRIGALMAGIVAQAGTGFSFYLHKVSKAVEVGSGEPARLKTVRNPRMFLTKDRSWSAWPRA